MSDLKVAEIRKILTETPDYQNVFCVQAQIDEERYRLIIPGGEDTSDTERVAAQNA
jgi:hypothetical protein